MPPSRPLRGVDQLLEHGEAVGDAEDLGQGTAALEVVRGVELQGKRVALVGRIGLRIGLHR
jgi:hypothetical protein